MTLRADFFGELQKDEMLDDVARKIEVKPLREAQLCEVVSRPAALLGASFESDHLAVDIARRAAEESSNEDWEGNQRDLESKQWVDANELRLIVSLEEIRSIPAEVFKAHLF